MPEGIVPSIPDSGEPVATRQERVDFLKQAAAFTEANVRSFDVKAQISLAAFVLSGNPLLAIINGACGQPAVRSVLTITFVAILVTILSYLWVLWPAASAQPKLTEGLSDGNLFYIRDPAKVAGRSYSERLKGLILEPQLAAEVLKLSHIRKIKAHRFKTALTTTVVAYLTVAGAFFGVGRCAF